MNTSPGANQSGKAKPSVFKSAPPLEHYLQLIVHRKWTIISIFVVTTAVVVGVVQALPNMYTASTTILVDPQKVPESYVKSTVTGSVRDRLGTLSTQILSATRLQTIIDSLHLYQAEKRQGMNREEILAMMRKDIVTTVKSDFGPTQELQAFTISYSGREPRLVARVTNQLAQQFIEDNLEARESQSGETTNFLQRQLEDTRTTLEAQEAKLKEYRLRHLGEMPEQQSADLQILVGLQNQAQQESEALSRAEQQKNYYQSMMTQAAAPVIDIDGGDEAGTTPTGSPAKGGAPLAVAKKSDLDLDREKLSDMLKHYSPQWPDVIQLKKKIADEEAKQAIVAAVAPPARPRVPVPPPPPSAVATATAPAVPPAKRFNPVLQTQIDALDTEIAKHKQESLRLAERIANYQAKLEAIPSREQEITGLTRDYEMTKNHYAQLEGQSLSAQTATQLELSMRGQTFRNLDPATTPEKPSSPNRPLFNAVGALLGLLLGIMAAMSPEIFGMTIIASEDLVASNLNVLEIIPVITTRADQIVRRRRLLLATASMAVMTITASAILFLHFRNRI